MLWTDRSILNTICVWPQVDILFCYFGIRKFATHWVSLGFFCMLVPLSTFTPEVRTLACCDLFLSSVCSLMALPCKEARNLS